MALLAADLLPFFGRTGRHHPHSVSSSSHLCFKNHRLLLSCLFMVFCEHFFALQNRAR